MRFVARIRVPGTGVFAPRRQLSTSSPRLATYGFIGIGRMGYQMAKNLRANLPPSDALQIYDVNREAMERLAREMRSDEAGGAAVHLAESAADGARHADVVITVLPEPQHVESVYASIVSSASSANTPSDPPRLFIDCSTIDPTTSRRVSAHLASSAQGVLADAPMSGGVVGAAAGTLTFMLGAPDRQTAERATPVLLHMGRRVLPCGGPGAGLAAKLANNYLLAVQNVATAEAMQLGVRCGLDPKVLAGVINASTGRCWSSEVNNPVPGVVEGAPAGRDYEGGFGTALMRKDLRLAMGAAREAGARLELAEMTAGVYEAAEREERCRGRDFSVVYRYLGGED